MSSTFFDVVVNNCPDDDNNKMNSVSFWEGETGRGGKAKFEKIENPTEER